MTMQEFVRARHDAKNILPSIEDKVIGFNAASEFVIAAKELGLTVIMIQGSWDLTHAGHTQHIEEAEKHADLVLMRIASDEYVTQVKGEGRPIEEHRRLVVMMFEQVDAVFDDDTAIDPAEIEQHAQILAAINPYKIALETEDQHYKYKIEAIDYANKHLGSEIELVVLQDLPYLTSTTAIVQHIKDHYC